MIHGKFYFDSHGFPRAEYSPPFQPLGWYLEQDVQGSTETCDEVLAICYDVMNGEKNDWEGGGNAHTVSIVGNRVTIENEFAETDQVLVISIEDFSSAVRSWKQLLQSVSQ
ncbi:MAG: hypothetical protein KF851_08290 [Pirellulaceae bacterium]|nr:hypothetical protein [Pirellulaceae bacterium]